MKVLLKILAIMAMVYIFTGCEYETIDGKIPEAYLSQAQNYVGRYVGQFGRSVKGELEISIVDRAPIITFRGTQNEDILGSSCHAQIGKLIGIREELVLSFELFHNCPGIEGHTLRLSSAHSGIIDAYVDKDYFKSISFCENIELPLDENFSSRRASNSLTGEAEYLLMSTMPNPTMPSIPMPDIPEVTCSRYFKGEFTKVNSL